MELPGRLRLKHKQTACVLSSSGGLAGGGMEGLRGSSNAWGVCGRIQAPEFRLSSPPSCLYLESCASMLAVAVDRNVAS